MLYTDGRTDMVFECARDREIERVGERAVRCGGAMGLTQCEA